MASTNSIGNDPAFGDAAGMTYRQWLIGQCAAGICASPNAMGFTNEKVAVLAVLDADAILKELDKERTHVSNPN